MVSFVRIVHLGMLETLPMGDHLLPVSSVTVATRLHHVIQRQEDATTVLTILVEIIVNTVLMVTIETRQQGNVCRAVAQDNLGGITILLLPVLLLTTTI